MATGIETDTCSYNPSEHTRTRIVAINDDAHDWNTDSTTITPATETTDGVEAIICKHNSTHTKDSRFNGEYATGTAGLSFTAINSNAAYSVSQGTATGAIHIPAYYRPNASSAYLPITEISNGTDSRNSNAFGGISGSTNTTVTSITFAENSQLTAISNFAFYNCQNLTGITLPASLRSIGESAFQYCGSLTSGIEIPEGVTSIEEWTFSNTGLTSITLPASLTTIVRNSFSSCISLTSIIIPASVTEIGDSAFFACRNLASVTILEGVTSIRGTAFGSTGLTSITIPASVTSIGGNVFYNCTSLTAITVAEDNPNYTSENGILYNKAKTSLMQVPAGISGTVTIPAGVTSIEYRAFNNCAGLTGITIPTSVTSIGGDVFSGCRNLTDITIPASVTSVDDSVFRMWTASQTIYIEGYASEAAADAAWNSDPGWREMCNAVIKYWNGSSYQ
jgi:hypothetical protein